MAVEHAEAPRRQHQQRDTREQDAYEIDRERARVAGEAGREDLDEHVRERDARECDRARDEREQRADGARDERGLRVLALGLQPRVDRDERRGQHALAEQVLQQIRNAQRRAKRAGIGRDPEVVRDRTLADQPGEARQHDPRLHRERAAAAARGLGHRRIVGQRSHRCKKAVQRREIARRGTLIMMAADPATGVAAPSSLDPPPGTRAPPTTPAEEVTRGEARGNRRDLEAV